MIPKLLKHWLTLASKMDVVMLLLMAFLLATGCAFIYGVGQKAGGRFTSYWLDQLLFVGLGSTCFLAVCLIDYRFLGRWSWLLYLGSIVLLSLVWLIGWSANQAQSWLVLPVIGKRIQPAEMAKPATVLFAAWVTSRPILLAGKLRFVVPALAVAAVPVVLIGMQPDLGTALVFGPAILSIIFIAGVPWKWIAGAVIAAGLLVRPIHDRLDDHQKARIQTFLNPSADVSGVSWNAHQSLLAVGSGGMTGKGFMKGTQHVLGFLPRTVASTDFIFSVIAEELGFVGALAIVCSFIGLVLCCLRTAALASDPLGAFVAVGIAAIFFTHAYINIGMTIRAAPIIGIPLPFVSYGGSFLVSAMILAGLVQSVHVRRKELTN
ncbi:MAG: rod shape-determining protein RodA [Lentisphaerae bacterium]|jgi:rod shape determining protein RodA|nr:rod shape-determining protein RodA [Lentisphaerota bacterium]MBT5610052.1 rod shape-determining protein RodA [Lentisphaerota bacterium]MBT7055548.1 rod shape-determining protein RodA [Lentisphaerota bacterium]MBT7841497.1 rod shape-determining protein RodA [Lentisphaerota bacterium]